MTTEACLFTADEMPSTGRSRAHRILAAVEPVIELPALVRRGAEPEPISLERAARGLRGLVERCGALTVDVETSGYPVGHRHYQLRTIQLGGEAAAVVFDATDPDHTAVVWELLAAAPRLHAHSATADLVPLAHAGLVDYEQAWARMHDTVIPAKLADPTGTGSDPGLKKLAGKVLKDQATAPAAEEARCRLFKLGGWLTDTEATTPPTRSGWARVDSRWSTMVCYAAADVLDTAALARQLPSIPAKPLDRERTVQAMTAREAFTGLALDHQQVTALRGKHTQARAEAARRVRTFGINNPGSDQQIAQALRQASARLPLTDAGNLSVAAEVLAPLRHQPGHVGELVTAVLAYREHDTLLTTFLEPYDQLVHYGDGRVRPMVYTLGARTGRMSCVRPNCQNLPRTGGVRRCITADPGWVLVSADFAGIELRVAAALSGDTNLRRLIIDDVDIHWLIARQVFGPQATKADRYAVKPMVYGKLYGAGLPTLAAQVGLRYRRSRGSREHAGRHHPHTRGVVSEAAKPGAVRAGALPHLLGRDPAPPPRAAPRCPQLRHPAHRAGAAGRRDAAMEANPVGQSRVAAGARRDHRHGPRRRGRGGDRGIGGLHANHLPGCAHRRRSRPAQPILGRRSMNQGVTNSSTLSNT